jgi:hypothetical protein
MDLAKIIVELKVELRCLEGVIASVEELARVRDLPDPGARQMLPSGTEPAAEETLPPKRRRGRPRKNEVLAPVESAPAVEAGSPPPADNPATSRE